MAQRIVRFWGGGGTYYRVPPPKPVLEASESGIRLVCARFLEGKKLGVNKRGGGTHYRWGGKTGSGKGFYGKFSPPLSFPPLCFQDAASLLTVGSFLLTVEPFYLQLTILVFLLTIGVFLLTVLVFCLQLEFLCLQWESASNKGLKPKA